MPWISQRPDGSILPSAVLGAGASSFGLPSGVRGIPGVVCLSHWAEAEADAVITSATAAAIVIRCTDIVILPPDVNQRITPRHGSAASKHAGWSLWPSPGAIGSAPNVRQV